MLLGDIKRYIEGNEQADALAKEGTQMPATVDEWGIQNQANCIVVFNNTGRLVEGNVRKHVLKTIHKRRNGPYAVVDTNTTLTREVIQHVEAAKASDFQYKIRHWSLPMKDATMHLYWHDEDKPKTIPIKLHNSRTASKSFLAKQELYKNQSCLLCGEKETQEHALRSVCVLTRQEMPALQDKIKNMIKTNEPLAR